MDAATAPSSVDGATANVSVTAGNVTHAAGNATETLIFTKVKEWTGQWQGLHQIWKLSSVTVDVANAKVTEVWNGEDRRSWSKSWSAVHADRDGRVWMLNSLETLQMGNLLCVREEWRATVSRSAPDAAAAGS